MTMTIMRKLPPTLLSYFFCCSLANRTLYLTRQQGIEGFVTVVAVTAAPSM